MTIELEGYEKTCADTVYIKDSTMTPPEGAPIACKSVLFLKRYTERTEAEVVEYLKARAEEANSPLLVAEDTRLEGKSPLEAAIFRLLLKLPKTILSNISLGDEETVNFIREHTSAPALKQGESPQYIQVKFGLLPVEKIEASKDQIKDESGYAASLADDDLSKNGLGEKWVMRITLSNGCLPDRMDTALIIASYNILGNSYSIDEGREVLNPLYSALTTPDQTSQLTDISKQVLEIYALQATNAIWQNIEQQRRLDKER